uniref:Secreted protein n=1 Tax=Amphimedon queenslandica TaxID=400682 RepID=A0A1X7UJ32_AMPQE
MVGASALDGNWSSAAWLLLLSLSRCCAFWKDVFPLQRAPKLEEQPQLYPFYLLETFLHVSSLFPSFPSLPFPFHFDRPMTAH